MAAPKRTPAIREYHLTRIVEMTLMGKTQDEIAQELGISQPQVSYDMAEIRRRWRQETTINLDEAKHLELAKIDLIWKEAMAAWQRSIGERVRTTTEHAIGGIGGGEDRTTIEREELAGDPRFLQSLQWCVEQRCKILGLHAPTRTANLNIDLTLLSDAQLQRIAEGEDPMQVIADEYLAVAR